MVLKRRLPKRFGGGTIFVSPDAALRFWKRDLEAVHKALFDWAEEFVSRGQVVWDIGANVGVFTFAAAYKAGPSGLVVAVEPDIFLVDLLRRTAKAREGSGGQTIILPVAVSESIAIQTFCVAARGRASNYLEAAGGRTQTGGVREKVSAVTVTLDWLAGQLPRPNLLKIDVEGAEDQVLKGGEKLLREARPTVICEVGGGHQEAASERLHSCGYKLFDLQDRSKGVVEKAVYSTLAVPD